MSKQLVRAATDPDPFGWRAGTVRVLANALLGVAGARDLVTSGPGALAPLAPGHLAPIGGGGGFGDSDASVQFVTGRV